MPTFSVQTLIKNSIESKINAVHLIQSNGKEKEKETQELDEGARLTLCSAMVAWTTSLHICV